MDQTLPPQKIDLLRHFVEEAIRFNKELGMQLESAQWGSAVLALPFREALVGDHTKNILHGGVISSLIDATGGATAFTVMEIPRERGLNTVDLRVDYVRPGGGSLFRCTGHVIRKGNRLCVTRMELVNDEDKMIAHGTAVYSILAKGKQQLIATPDDEDEEIRE